MKNLIRSADFLRPYVWQVLASLLMLLAITGMNLVVPRIIQTVIDDGILRGNTLNLVRSALLLFGLGLVQIKTLDRRKKNGQRSRFSQKNRHFIQNGRKDRHARL